MDLRELAGQSAQNCGRVIGRAVIGNVQFVAELGDVAKRGFDKEVLIPDEGNADNPWRAQSRCLP